MKPSRTKTERAFRMQEYLRLKSLPYLSFEQAIRFRWLQEQRVLDNKAAFNEQRGTR